MGRVEWNGEKWQKQFNTDIRLRVTAAAIYLTNVIKADISQPGTLVYSVIPGGKFKRTIRNFTHSLPGNPPYLQTGRLRGSIAWELVDSTRVGEPGIYSRVGTNLKYGLYLETGTRKMSARPYIKINMMKHRETLKAILTRKIGPGNLPPIVPNVYRSGYLGAGARKLGYL